jgi:hypothetical protein
VDRRVSVVPLFCTPHRPCGARIALEGCGFMVGLMPRVGSRGGPSHGCDHGRSRRPSAGCDTGTFEDGIGGAAGLMPAAPTWGLVEGRVAPHGEKHSPNCGSVKGVGELLSSSCGSRHWRSPCGADPRLTGPRSRRWRARWRHGERVKAAIPTSKA